MGWGCGNGLVATHDFGKMRLMVKSNWELLFYSSLRPNDTSMKSLRHTLSITPAQVEKYHLNSGVCLAMLILPQI